MGTDWTKFASLKQVILLAISLLIFLVVVFFVGIYSKKNVEIWGVKITIPDSCIGHKYDTTHIFVYDTIRPTNRPVEKLVSVKQSNKGSAVPKFQNNGTVNGIMGDNGTINNYEPVQKHPDLQLINHISADFPNKDSLFKIFVSPDKQLSKVFANELKQMLEKNGCQNVKIDFEYGMSMPPNYGVKALPPTAGRGVFVQVD